MSNRTKTNAKQQQTALKGQQKTINGKLGASSRQKPLETLHSDEDDQVQMQEQVSLSEPEEYSESYGEHEQSGEFELNTQTPAITQKGVDNNNSDGVELTAEQKYAEANIHWETVEYIAIAKVPYTSLLKDLKSGRPQLVDDGQIVFDLATERLKYGKRTNGFDFALPDTKKEAAKAKLSRDIVKSIEIKNFRMNYDNLFVISVNVPKCQSEEFYDSSHTVSHVVMPGDLATENSFSILDRSIPNWVINFHNRFPGVSPDTFAKNIQKTNNGLSLVGLNSPLIAFINLDKRAHDTDNGRYEVASVPQTNQVLVPNKLVREYKEKTAEILKKSISYASVTNGDISVVLSVPVPEYRRDQHTLCKQTKGQEGQPFLGFADPYYKENQALSSNASFTKNEIFEKLKDQHLDIQFRMIVTYRKLDKKIDLNL
jgi:hypothetical protein